MEQENSAKNSYEIWWQKNDSLFSGVSFILENSDTIFTEKMTILTRHKEVFFSAEVSHSPAPVYFKLTEKKEHGVTFENPEHNFPKKIKYWLQKPGRLHAQIEGDGKVVDFYFKRID